MATQKGTYEDVYIKHNGEIRSLKEDVIDFCEKYIKPVHPRNWDWSSRDFENPKNDPTIAEARAIRDVIYRDMNKSKDTVVDLSTMNNLKAMKAYLNPKSKHEEFNMEEFAFALKVELEHGKLKAVNVTNNHPFLTAMIAMAHMTESLTYYKRLAVICQKEITLFHFITMKTTIRNAIPIFLVCQQNHMVFQMDLDVACSSHRLKIVKWKFRVIQL